MAERDSWAVNSAIDQVDARMAIGALWLPGTSAVTAKAGFRPGPGTATPGSVAATAPTPDANVTVAAFQAVITSSRTSGPYIATLDAPKVINVLSTPAHGSLARDDLIVAQQRDASLADADSAFEVRHIVGTPAASPTDPSVPGSPDYIPLARVRVPAGATAITGSNITDLRPTPLYTVAVGGVLPISSSAERATLSPYPGQEIYRLDWGHKEVWTGSEWRALGVINVSTFSSLATAVSSPYEGQLAFVRDVDQFYVYTGSAWISTRYSCRISRSTTQNITTSTFTTIDFDTADTDLPGGMDDLANNRITLPVTGDWLVGFQTGMTGTDPDGARQAEILVNGSTAPVSINQASSGSGINPILNASGLARLTAGDQLTMRAWQNSGSTLTTVTPTYMWAKLVAKAP